MKKKKNYRRGAAALEVSLVLGVFLMTTMGMFDFGRAVFLQHVLTHAARQGARRAIVHGQLAKSPWGTTQISDYANSSGTDAIVNGANDGIAKMLVGCNLSNTLITVNWNLNGSSGTGASNAVGANVRVTVSSPYTPIMPFLSGGTLTAASTMQITH